MQPTKTKFFFKSRKDKDEKGDPIMVDELEDVKNEKGEVTGQKPTGKKVEKVIPAIPTVEQEVMLLTAEDIVAMFNAEGSEKQVKLVVEACNNIILEQARDIVNEDPETVREKGFPTEKLSWEYISNMPPAARKGAAIKDEVWEAFKEDYVSVMKHHGKTEEKAKMGAKLMAQKFQPVKMNKKVLSALQANLGQWFSNTSKKEDFQEVYETLANKLDNLLVADEDAVLSSI